MEKIKKMIDINQKNLIIQKSELKKNLNSISKNIIKKLSQDPQYETVSMNQVKKIINDNFISPEEEHIWNSSVMKKFMEWSKDIPNDTWNEETDTDSFKEAR